MDKTRIDEMNAALQSAERAYRKRVRDYAKRTGMPEHWVQPIVKAQVTIEGVQFRIAQKMEVEQQDAEAHALEVAGNRKKDAENIGKYGVSQWAFAKSYLALQEIDDLARGDSPFPAIYSLAKVADTLLFAMEVLGKEQRARHGSKGGQKSAAVTASVREEAIRLANEMVPDGGWTSAPKAAEEILPRLIPFAVERGRRPSIRKVEEWLRDAGIKKARTR